MKKERVQKLLSHEKALAMRLLKACRKISKSWPMGFGFNRGYTLGLLDCRVEVQHDNGHPLAHRNNSHLKGENMLTVYRCYVNMGPKEYGNEKMEQAAQEVRDANPDKNPLLVTVYEHGGWFLSYAFIGENKPFIVGTANDMAQLSLEARNFGEKYRDAKVERLEDVRRS